MKKILENVNLTDFQTWLGWVLTRKTLRTNVVENKGDTEILHLQSRQSIVVLLRIYSETVLYVRRALIVQEMI